MAYDYVLCSIHILKVELVVTGGICNLELMHEPRLSCLCMKKDTTACKFCLEQVTLPGEFYMVPSLSAKAPSQSGGSTFWSFHQGRIHTCPPACPEQWPGILHIRHLSALGVETPFAIICAQFWPDIWVAISATISITCFVLQFKMKYIYGQGNIVKVCSEMLICVILPHCSNPAVVVMPDNPRK
jgi:hypothetical protein